jgi:hypothetical protein
MKTYVCVWFFHVYTSLKGENVKDPPPVSPCVTFFYVKYQLHDTLFGSAKLLVFLFIRITSVQRKSNARHGWTFFSTANTSKIHCPLNNCEMSTKK